MTSNPLDHHYWDNRYQLNQTGWDIGFIATPIKEYINQLSNKELAILIPGCGNAYEAEYLLQQGFTNITVIDISPLLTRKLAEKLAVYCGKQLHIICGDFFELEETFDLVIEQTFFCALHPSLREKYVIHMHHLLKEKGKLVGLLFNRSFEGGPPFGGDEAEYRQLFEPFFMINKMETAYNSIAPRAGSELWINLQKKRRR
jgi:methyl halide transferase